MCWCCGCSTDPFRCTYFAAIISMVESLLFIPINIVFMLMYTCSIEPQDPPPNFIGEMWTWFFYDVEQCRKGKLAEIYNPPEWIDENEEKAQEFNNISIYENIDPTKNYSFQITYLVFHILWFLSALHLIYGNARRRHFHYLPWIFITLFLVIFDIVITSFYIKFWNDWQPGWEEGAALFAISFIYIRGYAIEMMNIILLLNVLRTWKRAFAGKSNTKIQPNVQVIVGPTVIHTHKRRRCSSTSSSSSSSNCRTSPVIQSAEIRHVESIGYNLTPYPALEMEKESKTLSSHTNEGYVYESINPSIPTGDTTTVTIPRVSLKQTSTYSWNSQSAAMRY